MHLALRAFLLPALAVLPLGAQAGLLVPSSTGRPDAKILSLREMTVDLCLARGYARVNVRQVFENHTEQVQEGTYRFNLPPSAAVGDFAVWDGLQRIPGVILEKKRARSIYQELTRQKIDPGLLQQGEEEEPEAGGGVRPSAGSLFSVTVAPIPPMATKRLEIQFQQETPIIGGQGEFRLVLRPPGAEPPVAGTLTVRVKIEDGAFEAMPSALPLQATAEGAAFTGQKVKLDKDLALRFKPRTQDPLRLTAFRNPEGTLPEGLALAPWERPSEIPPEKDGFFLLEAMAPGGVARAERIAPAPGGQNVAILFDTSLAHRWGGLEAAYGYLVRVLQALRPEDHFALIPFDRQPATAALLPVTPGNLDAQLSALRQRPLGPGADLPMALAQARKVLADQGRILLLTSGQGSFHSKALKAAAGPVPVFTAVTVGEAGEALVSASTFLLSPTSTDIEGDLFFQRLLGAAPAERPKRAQGDAPFSVTGGEPRLRDLYPVLIQPLEPGSLTGWIGRYGAPAQKVRFEWTSPLFAGGKAVLDGALPEKALEARDLPRRWARARVDDLLRRMEAEGERREWIEEIIALSKRYKFVTPYTAFLAAPRSLLRPRRIQPGDPVLRVECDPGTVSATALFPFGLKLDLVHRPASNVWEGRFLVPEGLPDGQHAVRILMRDVSGARVSETKHFVLDGKPPAITPALPTSCRAGEVIRIAAATDADVVFLSARVGEAPPIPLRWDAGERRCVGLFTVPYGATGPREVVFEAVDAAKNRGFARATLEVKP